MFYYEVAPADKSYKNDSLLTYCSESKLEIGQIVVVKVRTKTINAFVVKPSSKPSFKVKEIDNVYTNITLPVKLVDLFMWFCEYYPGLLGASASLFLPNSIAQKIRLVTDPPKKVVKNIPNLPILTKQQEQIINEIISDDSPVHIIHGDTGSGKTRIYIELCRKILANGKSVLILTPEISLTPQIAEQFYEQFGNNVLITHSSLTIAKRREIWLKSMERNKPNVIIGPRSALFMPLSNIGLIVVDEFHDSAYKQEQSPRYHALRVAAKLNNIHHSKLILGSATPPIEDYFYTLNKGSRIHRLNELPKKLTASKTIKVVLLNQDSERTNYDLLSKTLINELSENLQDNQQSLVFINKRGTTRTIICQNCGWIDECNRCNIPYVYHHDKNILLCHTCGQKTAVKSSCPECGSTDIHFKNPGTKQIAADLEKIFPNAKIGRYDKDNKKNETFSANHQKILSGEIDILVGTQLLTKGHDLPNLSLVGVLNSESGLQFPDYSSAEKNFQLLHQIVGRVGRGHLPGRVIVQTFRNPEKIKYLTEQKTDTWQNFYDSELASRKQYGYPPFVFILKIEMSRAKESTLIKNIEQLASQISTKYPNVQIVGPAPSLISLRNNRYFWQIIIKSKRRSLLTEIVSSLPKDCSYDLDPINLI